MLPRSKTVWLFRWGTVFTCLSALAIFAVPHENRRPLRCSVTDRVSFGFWRGALYLNRLPRKEPLAPRPPAQGGCGLRRFRAPYCDIIPFLSAAQQVDRPSWRPAWHWYQYGNFLLELPLWTVACALALAAALLWHRRAYRTLPGHCHHCGYNLTGNLSGRCPECGTTTAHGPAPTG